MSRDIAELKQDFRQKIIKVLKQCADDGFELRPFFTMRSPITQAKLWRQSRSGAQVREAIEMLRAEGADFLADCLERAGPQNGRWATNALPGQSWHQHGLAIDCFVLEEGRSIWKSSHPGYEAFAIAAEKQHLVSGHRWGRKDSVHVQAMRIHKPEGSWSKLDSDMRDLWQDKLSV